MRPCVVQSLTTGHQTPQNLLAVVNDRAVEMHFADDVVLAVLTFLADRNDASQKFPFVRQNAGGSRDKADILAAVVHHAPARQNRADDFTVNGDDPPSGRHGNAQPLPVVFQLFAVQLADKSTAIGIDAVTSAQNARNDFAVVIHRVFQIRRNAQNLFILVQNGAVHRKASQHVALIAQSFAVGDDFSDDVVGGTAHLPFGHDAPQTFAVLILDQPFKIDAAELFALGVDRIALRRHAPDDFARFVDDGILPQRQTDLRVGRVHQRTVVVQPPDLTAGCVDHFAQIVDRPQRAALFPDGNGVDHALADHDAGGIRDRVVGLQRAQNAIRPRRFQLAGRINLADDFVFKVQPQPVFDRVADHRAVQRHHRAVRHHAADHVAFQIDDRSVCQHTADQFAVFIIDQPFGRPRVSDHVAVQINNRSVGQHPPDHVAVQIDDRSVGQNAADDVAVLVINQTFQSVADFADDLAAVLDDRPAGAVTHRFAVGPQNGVAVFVNDRAVNADIADDLAVGTDDRLTDRNDFADHAAVLVNDLAVQIGLADHAAGGVNDRSVGHDDTQNLTVRPDNLSQTDENLADDLAVLVHDFAGRHFQPPQRTGKQIDRRAGRQQTTDRFTGFDVENVGFAGDDAAGDAVVFAHQSGDCHRPDEIRSFQIHRLGYGIAAGIQLRLVVDGDALGQRRTQKLVVRIDKDGIGAQATDLFARGVVQRSVDSGAPQIGVLAPDRPRAVRDAPEEIAVFVGQHIVHMNIGGAFKILIHNAAVNQYVARGLARPAQSDPARRRDARDRLAAEIDNRSVRHRPADRRGFAVGYGTVRHHPTDRAAVAIQNTAERHDHPRRFVFGIQNDAVGIQTSQNLALFILNFARRVRQSGDTPVRVQSDGGIENAPQNDFLVVQNFTVRGQATDKFALCRDHLPVQIGVPQRHTAGADADVLARQCALHLSFGGQETLVGQDAAFDLAVADDTAVRHDAADNAALVADNRAARQNGGDDFFGIVNHRAVRRQTAQRIALEVDRAAVRIDFADHFAVPIQQSPLLHIAANRIAGHIDDRHRRRQPADLFVRGHDGTVRADPADHFASRADGQALFDHAADDVAVLVHDKTVGQNAADDVAVLVHDRAVGHDDAQNVALRVNDRALRHDGTDDVAVGVNDRAVGVDIADDIAVFIDDRTVGHDPPDRIAVFIVSDARSDRRADHVAVQIDDRPVRQSVTDQLAVLVNDAPVRQNRSQNLAVRPDRQPCSFRHADDVALIVNDRSVGAQSTDALAVQPVHNAVFIGVPDRFAVGPQNDAPFLAQLIQNGTAAPRRFVADAAHTGIDGHCRNGNDHAPADAAECFVAPPDRDVGLYGARRFRFPAHDDVARHVAAQHDVFAAFVFQNESVFLFVFKFDGRDADAAGRRRQGQRPFRRRTQNDLIETQAFGRRDQPDGCRLRFFFSQIERIRVAAGDAAGAFGRTVNRDLGVFFALLVPAQQNDDARQERQQSDDPDDQQHSVGLF